MATRFNVLPQIHSIEFYILVQQTRDCVSTIYALSSMLRLNAKDELNKVSFLVELKMLVVEESYK